jgi:hypothetical protein
MSQGGPLNSSGGGGGTGMPIQTITGNTGGPVGPDAFNNFNLPANTAMGITTVGNAGLNTINIVGIQATTSQVGVTALSSNAQAIAGTDITNAITPASLAAKLGTQTQFGLPIGGGSSAAISWTAAPTNGQLLIGSTGLTPVLNTITAGAGIGISNGAGTITISNTGGSGFTYTNVNTTPYVVLPADQFLGVDCSGGAITIQLPNAPSTGRVIIVKDRTGSSLASNITVTTVGGAVTIDGATTYVMKSAYFSIELLFDGVTYQVF